MAIISKQEMWLESPEGERIDYTITIKYSAKLKEFYINEFPKQLIPFLDGRTVIINYSNNKSGIKAETQKELEKELQKVIKLYKDSATIWEKIIAYKIYSNALIIGKNGVYNYIGEQSTYDRAKESETELQVKYFVVYREKILSRTYYYQAKYYEETGNKSSINTGFDNYKEMDWTESRETFFKDLTDAMKKLIVKMDNFFNEDNMDKKIDYFQGNLLSFKEDSNNQR